ncbi:MAG: hypothetical protein J7K40_08970 [candidate division Zixibacteria bacterium]|nr:hypothetical protein [candidate division Zixibacteria bacterium]
MIIKGKKAFGEYYCDVVINDMDILKPFASEQNINISNHSKVVFLVY